MFTLHLKNISKTLIVNQWPLSNTIISNNLSFESLDGIRQILIVL